MTTKSTARIPISRHISHLMLLPCLLLDPLSINAAELEAKLLFNNAIRSDVVSQTAIRSIFAMRTSQWPDGAPVHVFVLQDTHPTHIAFCKQVLGMFPYQLRRIWDRQVYSGTGISPTIVSSEQEMRDRVANTVGAVGYISAQADSNLKTNSEAL